MKDNAIPKAIETDYVLVLSKSPGRRSDPWDGWQLKLKPKSAPNRRPAAKAGKAVRS